MEAALLEKNNKKVIESTSLVGKHVEYGPALYDLAELEKIGERESFPWLIIPLPTYRESFIGILTDEEAREMKEGISLFKKRFDDDLARRYKILFGE